MTSVDPATGKQLPADAIQRVLHVTAKVHVYGPLPPLMGKGYNAAPWTAGQPIFSGRLRVLETAVPSGASAEKVTVAVLLEDGSTGELFAAAPYTHPTAVQQALDSSRAFALRIVGEGGMRATLGLFFEERSEAFDFGVTLQDAAKTLDFAGANAGSSSSSSKKKQAQLAADKEPEKKDYSLKEGQTITVNFGGARAGQPQKTSATVKASNASTESGAVPFLPPPPSASEVKRQMDSNSAQQPSAKDLGFDDGEFGEFQ